MATANPQGIMALPMEGASADTGAPAQPQLGLDDSYDAVQQGLQNASPDAYSAVNAELANLVPQLDQLPDEVLDQLLQIVQYMHDRPKEYAQLLKDLIDQGIVDQGDFPDEYDPEFLATLGMVIMQARKNRQGAQQGAMPIQEAPVPPAGMARGGIAEAAHMVASRGRGQDTMLAHITPKEAKMLRAKGGMGTINPATGLPEYGFWKRVTRAVKGVVGAVKGVVKGVAGAVKSIVSSPIGKIVATVALAAFIGPAAFGLSGATGVAAQMALASGAVTALGGGNINDILKSAAIGGATAFFGAPGGAVSNFVGGAVTNAAANAAITSGIVGTGIGLLSGQKLQDAVKGGLTAGAISGLSTGYSKGFDAQIEAPKLGTVGEMAKNQAGENVSGKYNPETGKFDLPEVVNRDTVAGQNAAPVRNPDGTTTALLGRAAPDATGQAPSITYGNGPTATDPLGDFIQQNDAARELAGTPARAAPPAQGYQTPTVGQSLKTMGGGILDIAQGDFSKGFEGISKGAGDLFLPSSPTPSDVMGSKSYTDLVNQGMTPDKAFEIASKELAPSMIRSYGPAVAAGLGIAGLSGAFTPKPPEPTPEEGAMNARLQAERDRVAANPGSYVPKGLEKYGIVYNDRGEIVGSNPWSPDVSSQPTEVAGDYMAYKPSPYMTPSGAIGSSQPIYQPYNTASMYTNLMPPQYRADGGMMTAEPMHFGIGGTVRRSIRGLADQIAKDKAEAKAAEAEAAEADRATAIRNSYRPPVQPVQSQVQQPTEVTQYQQPYDPSQVSDLLRRLYPSIYDRDYRDSILSNTAMGNSGGIASLASGGYPRRTGQISGPGTATSDSIPAMLSDGEFVMTAKAVRGAGKGSRLAGAKKMYALMHQLERNAARG
jgi:hypothetical protein